MAWSEQDEARLIELKSQFDKSWASIAEELGKTVSACKHRWRDRLRNKEEEPEELGSFIPITIETGREGRSDPGWRHRLATAMQVKQDRKQDDIFTRIAKVTIKTDKPYAVLISSDWQMGDAGTDLLSWQEHMESFLTAEHMGMLVDGDLINNTCTHKTLKSVFEQVLNPNEQMKLVSSLLQEIVHKKKLLGLVLSEEHDLRSERLTGYGEFIEYVRRFDVPCFSNQGQLLLQVGDQMYLIHMIHKSLYGSSQNDILSALREFRMKVPANVIISAHRHRPAVACFSLDNELREVLEYVNSPLVLGGDTWLVQCGTYGTENDYGQKFFSRLDKPKLQILIFHPDCHKIEFADSFEAARVLLN